MDGDEYDIESVSALSEDAKYAIQSLAVALVQVGQAVDSKYLKKPLGGMFASNLIYLVYFIFI